MAKLKIELNDLQNLKDLIQEIYNLADTQITQCQNEINKLANSTQLQNEAMDSKSRYAKAINDYLSIKDKAISKKIDVAKIMNEIYQHNGNVKGAIEDGSLSKQSTFDFSKIKKMVDENMEENKKKIIDIRK